jgi:hypothetical protein
VTRWWFADHGFELIVLPSHKMLREFQKILFKDFPNGPHMAKWVHNGTFEAPPNWLWSDRRVLVFFNRTMLGSSGSFKAFLCIATGSSTNSSILTVVNPRENGLRVPCGGDSCARKNLAPSTVSPATTGASPSRCYKTVALKAAL